MQKNYWWRVMVLITAVGGVFVGYLIFYPYSYGLCDSSAGHCIFSSFKKTLAEPLFLLSLSLLAVSPFLFFISDLVFIKWLKFTVAWMIFAIILISATPTSVHSFSPLAGPDKESVSIWMGSLFVIISLVQIVLTSRKLKKNK